MKILKISAIIISMFLLLAFTSVLAATEGYLTYQIIDDYIEITGFNGNVTEVEIPSQIQDKDVKSIYSMAFQNKRNITSVIIADSVETIGAQAFSGCTYLGSIKLPVSLRAISSSTFTRCTSLAEIEIPGNVETIGSSAFINCTGLKKVIIPKSLREIGANAFMYCSAIEEVIYGGTEEDWRNITINGGNDFLTGAQIQYSENEENEEEPDNTCGENLTWSIENGVLAIEGEGEMSDWENPDDVPWKELKGDISGISIGEGVTSIGYNAFSYMGNITEVNIPEGITKIGNNAFKECTNLRVIYIPDSLTEIGDNAFEMCDALEDVFYNGSEEAKNNINFSVGNDAFRDKIECDYGSKGEIEGGGEWRVTDDNTLILEPETSLPDFESASDAPWYSFHEEIVKIELFGHGKDTPVGKNNFSNFSNLIEFVSDGIVNRVGEGAFWGCKNLETLDFYGNIHYIGDSAFYECSSIEDFSFADGSEYLGESAFAFCSKMREFEIPSGIEEIKNDTFSGCGSLERIEIPSSVKKIGGGAFAGCSSLSEITLSEGLEEIGERAFMGIEPLERITIPSSVKTIGTNAFMHSGISSFTVAGGNRNFAAVDGNLLNYDKTVFIRYAAGKENESCTIPATVKKIEDSAFEGSENIKGIKLNEGLDEIGVGAFTDCKALYEITLPDTVTSIGRAAFSKCEALEYASLNSGIEKVESFMFSDCHSLKGVKIPEGVKIIGEKAFEGCEALENITLPLSLEEIGEGAFWRCRSLLYFTIPDNVTTLSREIFAECENLEQVVFGDNVTTLPSDIFRECKALSYVAIPASLALVEENVFSMDREALKMIYYNGNAESFRNIEVRESNEKFRNTGRKYICWIYFYDSEDNFLYKAKNTKGEPLYACNVPTDEDGAMMSIYKDSALSEKYDLYETITENKTLYVEGIDGTKTIVSEGESTVETKTFFVVKGFKMKEGARVILALYNDGEYVGMQDAVYYHGDVIFATDIPHTDAKILVWGKKNLKPYKKAEKVNK